jgi:hypothetical protein
MAVTRPDTSNNEQSTPDTGTANRLPRTVWIGFALIIGLLVGAVGGLLSAAGGVPVPLAILAGGGSCGSSIALMLALVRYATGEHS